MDIIIERERKTLKIRFEGTVKGLLAKLNLDKETVVVVRNGSIVTEKDKVKDSDSIKILSVISGG